MLNQIAGVFVGIALGVPLSLAVTAPAKASYIDPCTTDAPICDPSLSVQPADPYCQWSLESGRRILVVGEGITRTSVDLGRNWQNVTSKPTPRRIALRNELVWVKVPKRYAEDDIQLVQAKIDGDWQVCEPA